MINDEPLVLDELNQSNDSLIANIISDSSDWSYTRSRWSKPHGKGWMKAYSNGIRFKYQNKWNKAKQDISTLKILKIRFQRAPK